MTSTLLWGTYKTNTTISSATVKYDGSSASITETAVLPCGTGPTWVQQHPLNPTVVLVVQGSELRTYRCDHGSHLGTSRSALPDWQQLSTFAPPEWRRIVHGSWSGDGSTIFAVDYDAAQVASFEVKGFNITTEINRITFSGHGAYAPLQSSPHPHQVVQHPHKPWLYVSDLGRDHIHVLDLDPGGSISLSSSAPTSPAFGPRHVAFHPSGDVLYSIGEIGCGVTTYEIDQSNGSLTSVVTVSTLPRGLDPTTAGLNVGSARGVMAGEVIVTKDGKHLYASNRNQQNVPQDTLAIFDLDSEHPYAPIMASKRVIGSEGLVPRGMKFDRKDRLLAVGNQNSSSVYVFERDAHTGNLTGIAGSVLPSRNQPTAVLWLSQREDEL